MIWAQALLRAEQCMHALGLFLEVGALGALFSAGGGIIQALLLIALLASSPDRPLTEFGICLKWLAALWLHCLQRATFSSEVVAVRRVIQSMP